MLSVVLREAVIGVYVYTFLSSGIPFYVYPANEELLGLFMGSLLVLFNALPVVITTVEYFPEMYFLA